MVNIGGYYLSGDQLKSCLFSNGLPVSIQEMNDKLNTLTDEVKRLSEELDSLRPWSEV